MKLLRLATTLLCLLAATRSFGASTQDYPLTDILPNGIARGWRDDSSWADVTVNFHAGQVFEEMKAQRVTQTHIARGRAQLAGPEVTVRKGMVYTLALRARSLSGEATPVELSIRDPRPPYKDYAARRSLKIPGAWQTLSYFFEPPADAVNYRLYLVFPQLCDIEIERITLREETRDEFEKRSVATATPPFAHANPTFSLGTHGWITYGVVDRIKDYPLRTGDQYSLEPPALTTRNDETGQTVGVLALGNSNSLLLSTLADINPGQPVRVIARLRRTTGEGPVNLKLFSPNWASAPSKGFPVGTEWTDLTFSGTPPFEEGLQTRVELSAAGEGELEIARLEITQQPAGKESAEQPATTFAATPDRTMTLYEVGETPTLTLRDVKGDGQSVTWRLADINDKTIREGTWKLSAEPAAHSFTDLPVGWYQLKWNAPWAAVQPDGVVNIGVVPPATRTAGDASPFGIHVEGSEVGVRKMQLLGAHWLRTNNPLFTKWTAVQPERDVWVYPDAYVDRFINAGLGIVFNLDRTPRWAARNPDNYRPGTDYMDFKADFPADLDAWSEYVRRMVDRYKDRIHYWEIWNEPDIPFLRPPEGMTNAEAYYQLVSSASPIIRELDPTAKIMMSPAYYLKKRNDPTGYQPDFTERFIEMGGMRFVDIYAIHFYLTAGQRTFDDPDRYQEKLDHIREAMAAPGRTPEIWNSEWGIINFTVPTHPISLPSTNGMTADLASRELVIWSVGQLAAGVEKLFWFDALDNFYYGFHVTRNLFDYREPKPTAVAYAVLSKELDGLQFEAEENIAGNAGRVLRFSDGTRQVRVAYAHAGQSFTITPPAGTRVTDYLGQPVPFDADGSLAITEAPLYLNR